MAIFADDIIHAITRGEVDSDLDAIGDAIQRRRTRVGYRTVDELRVGMLVRIKGIGAGGKYLNDAECVVTNVGRSRITVRIGKMFRDNGQSTGKQRFQVGSQVILHGQNLEIIDQGGHGTTALPYMGTPHVEKYALAGQTKNITPETEEEFVSEIHRILGR
jgi:hypothetical protein